MNVILLESLPNIGDIGAEVNVANGYARNYLLPKKMALKATASNREYFEMKRVELENIAAEKLKNAEERAARLVTCKIEIKANASDEGKLYGSITPRDIAMAFAELGHEVAKSEIDMVDGAIRELGEHNIRLNLHSKVQAPITIAIMQDK
jgi:large subunit ribosomal protein L9